ncbi:YidB family protein [Nocardiopsis sediminis]|uniref:YidB family protein n=1 Tax=Nocardiopsis sediminis TaxID=1778267 RepID=A0ABV8FGH9_9ACTN
MAGENDLGRLLGELLDAGDSVEGDGGDEGGPSGDVLGDLLREPGGIGIAIGTELIEDLIQQLRLGGLGEQARSWVSADANEAVSGEEIAQALAPEELDEAAERAGMSAAEAAERLARILPQAIDGFTPEGDLPEI